MREYFEEEVLPHLTNLWKLLVWGYRRLEAAFVSFMKFSRDPQGNLEKYVDEYDKPKALPPATKPTPAPIAPAIKKEAAPPLPAPVPTFQYTEDFRSITFKGKKYLISHNQGQVLKRLWEASKEGKNVIHQDKLLEDLEIYSKRMQDVFKDSPAWKTLIVQAGKGFYKLNPEITNTEK